MDYLNEIRLLIMHQQILKAVGMILAVMAICRMTAPMIAYWQEWGPKRNRRSTGE
jgi:hypothetical protein